ncbi:MAG: transaldolase [Actinobacteria bacterium]|nr:transaldolase [Actinomycetota bacterium]
MNNIKNLKIKIFADGADIEEMKKAYKKGIVKGFTTNPYFLRLAGVSDYEYFAKKAVKEIPDMPLSFEVISDNFYSMEKEARIIASWGDNIFVKIPVTNTKNESSTPLIKKLSADGIKINATAVYTLDQVKSIAEALSPETESIISIFAGRIGETGVDPIPIVKKSSDIIRSKSLTKTELLWASTREVFNIFQAEECGCDIITVANDILNKLDNVGISLEQASLDTVKNFYECAQKSGYKI